MARGAIVLAGGHELRPGCEEMDERVLREVGRRRAHVVFLPTAVARYDPVGSGRGAVAYFRRLGATAQVAMILNRTDAARPDVVALLEDADLIYLGGGDPDVLLDALRDSPAWAAALRAHERGAVVGGSSAGAMVMCSHMLLPGAPASQAGTPSWVAGLGLVTNTLVLPHFVAARESMARALIASIPAVAILGIPEQSALLGAGTAWEVAGPGPVSVIRAESALHYGTGESVLLPRVEA